MRKGLVDTEAIEEFLRYLERGNFLIAACAISGLSRATVYSWMKKGRADIKAGKTDTPEAIFYLRTKQAEAKGEAFCVETISKASERYWQAAAWILERRWPKRWGKRVLEEDDKDPIKPIKVVDLGLIPPMKN